MDEIIVTRTHLDRWSYDLAMHYYEFRKTIDTMKKSVLQTGEDAYVRFVVGDRGYEAHITRWLDKEASKQYAVITIKKMEVSKYHCYRFAY